MFPPACFAERLQRMATLTMTAPVFNRFFSINFASYGTPNGTCGHTVPVHVTRQLLCLLYRPRPSGRILSPSVQTMVFWRSVCTGTGKRLYVGSGLLCILFDREASACCTNGGFQQSCLLGQYHQPDGQYGCRYYIQLERPGQFYINNPEPVNCKCHYGHVGYLFRIYRIERM